MHACLPTHRLDLLELVRPSQQVETRKHLVEHANNLAWLDIGNHVREAVRQGCRGLHIKKSMPDKLGG